MTTTLESQRALKQVISAKLDHWVIYPNKITTTTKRQKGTGFQGPQFQMHKEQGYTGSGYSTFGNWMAHRECLPDIPKLESGCICDVQSHKQNKSRPGL